MKTRSLTLAALLASLAMVLTWLERVLPLDVGIPGVKLGLANFVIVVVIYLLGPRWAFIVNLVRIVAVGLLFTGPTAMAFALAGGLVSFAAMWVGYKARVFSPTGVSVAGGVFHNVGQIVVAAFMVSNVKVVLFLPVLILSGVLAGGLTGLCAAIVLPPLQRFLRRRS